MTSRLQELGVRAQKGETSMDHLRYLGSVAVEDTRALMEKEATYRGSWKRRGGVGAFMMLARKWDRLESMAERCTEQYDIFKLVQFPGVKLQIGDDGTALAEIRDLRRYLLLVEAEMVARGVVSVPTADFAEKAPLSDATADVYTALARGWGTSREHAKKMLHERGFAQTKKAGAPISDSSRHAAGDEHSEYEQGVPTYESDHVDRSALPAAHVIMLSDSRAASAPTSAEADNRERSACQHLVIDRRVCRVKRPEILQIELNDKEHELLAAMWRGLYEWVDGDAPRWVMRPEYREHWGRR